LHPYTRGLFSSLVRVDVQQDRLQPIEGNVPAPTDFPPGCRFRDRCPLAIDKCREEPPLAEVQPGHWSACWRADELLREPHREEATR
jgi:oligopeptide/dipeptide ABC transporter ATP-binding protein